MPERRPPPAPKHLSPASKTFWRSVLSAYVLEPHHLELLRLACEALDRVSEARSAVEKAGSYEAGRFGTKPHPGIAVENAAAIRASRILRELGLDLEAPATSRPPTRWKG